MRVIRPVIRLVHGGRARWALHRPGLAAVAAVLTLVFGLTGGPVRPVAPARAQTQPSNDLIANPWPAGVPDLLMVDTRAATVEPGEPIPTCAPPGPSRITRTVWYTLEPTLPTVRVNTAGSGTSFLPILALYTRDTAGHFNQLACSSNLSLSASVTPGLTYYLQVGGADEFQIADGGVLSLVVGPVSGGVSDEGPLTANLQTSLAVTPDPIAPGADASYSAFVGNAGPDPAVAVTVTLTPSGAVTFRSITTPGGWICSPPAVGVGGPVTCAASVLPSGETDQFGIVVRVDPAATNGTVLSATFSASASGSTDPVPGDTSSSATMTVSVPTIPPPPPTPVPPAPTPCNPRPNVGVQARLVEAGRLEVTIRSATNTGTTVNALQVVQVRGVSNAVIDVPNGPTGAAGALTVPVQSGGQVAQFFVRRTAPGAFRADLDVTDACGPWRTFVGGGTGVP
jgi:hypothetical protein